MADGGWVRLEENVNYNTVYGECSYTGRGISRNGITYTLCGGYNSWSGANYWLRTTGTIMAAQPSGNALPSSTMTRNRRSLSSC